MVIMQYGGLLAARNRRVSILQSNPLWGPRRNLAVPLGMIGTVCIAVTNLYGPGLNKVFGTTPIPGMFWGLPFTFALGILTVDEVRKLVVRTYPKASIFCTFLTYMAELACSPLSPKWLGNMRCLNSKSGLSMMECLVKMSPLMNTCTYICGRL